VNAAVIEAPEKVNEDPYGEGWLVKIRLSEPDEVDDLLDAEAYKQLVDEQ
jgi:glycine cleavage system H protein